MNDKTVKDLYDFVDTAVRSRKYPENTGIAIKTALKLFEAELTPEEANSANLFKDNLDQIYNNVFNKNKLKFSAGSLHTYKGRVLRALSDYEKYGLDAAKMASWSPKVVVRGPKTKKSESISDQNESVRSPSDNQLSFAASDNMAPARQLPSGIAIAFPKDLDPHVSFGEFGEALKSLESKATELRGNDVKESAKVE